jgi:3-deoxy-D-manno-octulosonic-acid transferase
VTRPGPGPAGGPGPERPADPSHARHATLVPIRAIQFAYDTLYLLLLLLGAPFWLFKILFSRKWRSGLGQRMGGVPRRRGDRPCIWIHGVSVGEVLASRTLVNEIRATMPDWEIAITTITRSGQEVARRTFPDLLVCYFPLDFSFCTDRTLDRVRPSAVVLLELEIWPNFLLSTSRRGIPVHLVNGRITERSVRGWRRLQHIIPEPLDRIGLYCAQTPLYRDRFLALGVPPGRVFVTGTMKLDTVDTEGEEALRAAFSGTLGLSPGDWVLIAGSTHEGEEEPVLSAYRAVLERDPRARLVLAPRHLERLGAVEAAVRAAGFRPVRRTSLDGRGEGVGAGAVVVLDTMGELRSLYAVADAVFVGGSLVPHGGQNVLEPAGLGKAVVTGPHTWNFEEVVEELGAAGGLGVVRDAAGLREELLRLHGDRAAAVRRGAAAREWVLRGKGATRRTLDLVRARLGEVPGGARAGARA